MQSYPANLVTLTDCKMHPNNSNHSNHKVHVNPVFRYLAHKYAYSSETTANRQSTPIHYNHSYASDRLSNKKLVNPFNDFIKEKFYELSAAMYQDSIKAPPSNQPALPCQNQNTKYRWENHKPISVCDSSSDNESAPFHSVFSKGWFFHNSCDTKCISNQSFDVQSCCFINEQYLPRNTLNMPDMKKRVVDFYKKKVSTNSKHSLVSISKHKMIKKIDGPVKSSGPKRRSPNAPLLCTRSKLIRKSKPVAISMSLAKSEKLVKNLNKNFIVKRHSLVRINNSAEDMAKILQKRKRLNSSRSSNSSVVMLTKRKLIRKSTPVVQSAPPLVSVSKHKLRRNVNENLLPLISISKHKLSRVIVQKETVKSPEAEKLISINPNKLIKSSLLPKIARFKNDAFSNSVLCHMIRHRRRIHRGSGYVLLTRNKLIKMAKFKNKIWRKNKVEETTPKNCFNKMFVSLGNNKLIRKSLFAKTNKTDPEKKPNPISSPAKNALFARMLNSPSRRIQRFTNHMTRTKLKYTRGRNITLIRNRFSNKHKNNKKIIRKRKNTICPVYRKKGTCAKLLKGDCYRIHDRKYVALCQNFIRDNCVEKDCLLSHDLSSKKISICRRYLKNTCSYEECPYVHAKPTLEAPICPQFLQGYCENGETCTKWHIFACPEFKEKSSCSKDNCRLPHHDLSYFEGKFDESDDEDGLSWRYFEKNKIDERDNQSISIIPERLLLGDLPDYIPI